MTPRLILPLLALLLIHTHVACAAPNPDKPNVVIFFTDDQGYGDLSCFGNPTIHTPHLDQMAAEGMKLTQFYVASPVCSPSRAALLTGSYPKRINMHKHVIFPQYDYGMHTDEHTIADMLKANGYATGMFGKWHLGHREGLMPTDQGFDTFYGIPYSNDMSTFQRKNNDKYTYNLPLIRDKEVLEWEPRQHDFTKNATNEATKFIAQNKDNPFFVYIPHAMPHIPIYASEEFEGTSKRGLYGDVIEEIDWSVGRVIATLKEHGLDDNTIILFATDNGPWEAFRQYGGSAGPLRGAKGQNWEGGQRVPCIIRWPGSIPANSVCMELTRSIDILPTLAEITGSKLSDNKIDGGSIKGLLLGEEDAKPASDTFLYYSARGDLNGIRQGPWKLLFKGREAKEEGGTALFHLEIDISEKWNVAKNNPSLVERLEALAKELDAEITANARPTRTVKETLWDWPNKKFDDPNPNLQGRGPDPSE
ncbi:MAG: sulfatase family protein [Phycisphaeraceae bacterium]